MRQRLRAPRLIGLFGMCLTLGCSEESTTVNVNVNMNASVVASDVYQRACASCHGTGGTGGLPAREGAPAPRNFTEAAWQGSRSDEDLVRVVTGGKGPMPAFGDVLSPLEIEAVIEQVRIFGRAEVSASSGGR